MAIRLQPLLVALVLAAGAGAHAEGTGAGHGLNLEPGATHAPLPEGTAPLGPVPARAGEAAGFDLAATRAVRLAYVRAPFDESLDGRPGAARPFFGLAVRF